MVGEEQMEGGIEVWKVGGGENVTEVKMEGE